VVALQHQRVATRVMIAHQLETLPDPSSTRRRFA
jgi:hypothetical protein